MKRLIIIILMMLLVPTSYVSAEDKETVDFANCKTLMSFKGYLLITALLLTASGCALRTRRLPVSEDTADIEAMQNLRRVLHNIEKMAYRKKNLDYLGTNTMNEAVMVMDMGEEAVPMLSAALKGSKNWIFRYWIADIMGYMESRDCIIPLIELIEDNTEKKAVRIRACESLKELKFKSAVEYLLISWDLVRDPDIRVEIDKTIDYLRSTN